MKLHPALLAVETAAILCVAAPTRLPAQGSAFTYQGRLMANGQPADGIYDLRVALYDQGVGGTALALVTNRPMQVSGGLFTVTLDFGLQAFDGNPRWLELAVRTNGASGPYFILNPRQPATPTPYAITAGTITSPLPDAGLRGSYSNAVTLGNPANSFAGNGAGLTALDATKVSTGTLNDARLSTNVARLNADNAFSGTNRFKGAAILTNRDNLLGGTFVGPPSPDLVNSVAGALSRSPDFPFASVKSFGAVGDGVADDRAAIQATIDFVACSNRSPATVFFPPGKYKCLGQITLRVPPSLTLDPGKTYELVGSGKWSSLLLFPWATNYNAIDFLYSLSNPVGPLSHFTIRKLGIFGPATGSYNTRITGAGLHFGGVDPIYVGSQNTIEDCSFFGFHTGLVLDHGVMYRVKDCLFRSNWWAGIRINADTVRLENNNIISFDGDTNGFAGLLLAASGTADDLPGTGVLSIGGECGDYRYFVYNDSAIQFVQIGGNIERCGAVALCSNSVHTTFTGIAVLDINRRSPGLWNFYNGAARYALVQNCQIEFVDNGTGYTNIFAEWPGQDDPTYSPVPYSMYLPPSLQQVLWNGSQLIGCPPIGK